MRGLNATDEPRPRSVHFGGVGLISKTVRAHAEMVGLNTIRTITFKMLNDFKVHFKIHCQCQNKDRYNIDFVYSDFRGMVCTQRTI